jgi:hypothetical protein
MSELGTREISDRLEETLRACVAFADNTGIAVSRRHGREQARPLGAVPEAASKDGASPGADVCPCYQREIGAAMEEFGL